jgi:hypothetical protein
MSSFTGIFDKSGWLGMARTDPDWRGKGVAQFLQKSIAKYARKRGIRTLRFFVLSTNTASLRAASKGDFKPVAHATHVTCDVTKSKFLSKNQAVTESASGLVDIKQMLHSNYVLKMNGFLRYGYAFVRANQTNLAYIKNKKELYCNGKSSFILTRTGAGHGEFCVLTGKLRESLLKILRAAKEMRLRKLGGFIPHDYRMIRVSKNVGFKQDSWGKHSIVFEKRI